MAGEVNPQVPEIQPANYLGWSKPITTPESPKGPEYALTGIADTFKGGVGLAQFLQRSAEDDAIHQGVDKIRGPFTDSLATADAAIRKGDLSTTVSPSANPMDARAEVVPQQPMDILSDTAVKPLPDELQNLPNKLAVLDGGKANGRFSETDFDGRLVTLAKDLRTKYPNDRDYIDEKLKAVSGRDSANQYIKGMLSDINSFVTAQNENKNKLISKILDNTGIEGAPLAIQKVQSGQWGAADVANWMNPTMSRKLILEQRKALREDKEGTRKVSKDDAEDELNKIGSDFTTQSFHNLTAFGNLTPEKINTIMSDVASGKRDLSDNEAQTLTTYFSNQRTQAALMLRNKANEGGANSLYNILGPERANKIINDQLESTYGTVLGYMSNKQYGPAFRHMNAITSMQQDDKWNLFNNPDDALANYTRMAHAIQGMGDKFEQEFFKRGLENTVDIPGKMKTWIDSNRMKIVTQNQSDILKTGQPYTVKQAVEEAQQKNIKLPQVYSQFVGTVEQLADPKTPITVKENIAKAAFDPSNLGLISKFEKDGVDPVTGRPTAGQYSVYNRMLSPDILKEVHKLPGDAWNNTVDWAKQSFGRELLGPELKNLRLLQEDPGYSITWDSDNHRFGIVNKIGTQTSPFEFKGTPPGRNPQRLELEQTVNRINRGLSTLSNVAKEGNFDVNEYLLGMVQEMGSVDLERLQGAPEKMIKAIVSSRQQQEQKQEDLRTKYKVQ